MLNERTEMKLSLNALIYRFQIYLRMYNSKIKGQVRSFSHRQIDQNFKRFILQKKEINQRCLKGSKCRRMPYLTENLAGSDAYGLFLNVIPLISMFAYQLTSIIRCKWENHEIRGTAINFS